MKNTASRKTKAMLVTLKIILLLLAFVLLSTGYTLAKYVVQREQAVAVVAKNFYFESDLLSLSTGSIPQYTLQAGVNTISFTLMNYPDELRESEVDINYTVVLMKGNVEKTVSGVIEVGQREAYISFEDLETGTYTVIATATSPYTQELQGRFTIVGADNNLLYSVSDKEGSPNLKVTITTTDYSGYVKISWPVGVLPDNTDALLKDAVGQNCVVYVEAQSEYTFQLFKTVPSKDYTDATDAADKIEVVKAETEN